MAKRIAALSSAAKRAIPRVELIPASVSADQDPLRRKDLDDLIAQIVLLGRRKGRCKPQRDEEERDAA